MTSLLRNPGRTRRYPRPRPTTLDSTRSLTGCVARRRRRTEFGGRLRLAEQLTRRKARNIAQPEGEIKGSSASQHLLRELDPAATLHAHGNTVQVRDVVPTILALKEHSKSLELLKYRIGIRAR